jgi:oligoribonuclease
VSDLLVWVDLETTGLNDDNLGGLYAGGDILELGIAVTTADLEVIVAEESWLFALPHKPHSRWRRCGDHCDWRETVSDGVLDMHRSSGLWADLEKAHGDDYTGDPEFTPIEWLREHAAEAKGGPMCGSSVHFDREWLKHCAPVVHDWFGYRNLDVSTFREAGQRWWPDLSVRVEFPNPMKLHRALPDLHDTIAEARFWRAKLVPVVAGSLARYDRTEG